MSARQPLVLGADGLPQQLQATDVLANTVTQINPGSGISTATDPATGIVTVTANPVTETYINAAANLTGGIYLTDTSAGAFTVTLPATPAAGTSVTLIDGAAKWNTNNLTVNTNGHTVQGQAGPLVCDVQNLQFTLWFIGGGWSLV